MADMARAETATSVGGRLREWRRRRRMSQLALSLEAEVSQRHLSCLESGRAKPSREMLLHLAERLDAPLRERNAMLLAAGFAPVYAERPLEAPEMAPAMQAVARILEAHEPFPAMAVDRHWNLVASNAALGPLLEGIEDPALLASPVNVLRLALHPQGLAGRVLNLGAWRGHILHRLRAQAEATGDAEAQALWEELSGYPGGDETAEADDLAGLAVPLRLAHPAGPLTFITTTTVFGTAAEVTLSELTLECFFPADEATAALLRAAAEMG